MDFACLIVGGEVAFISHFSENHFFKMVMSQKELKMVGQCGLNAVLLYVFSLFPAFGFPKAIHYIYIGIYIYTYICIYVEHNRSESSNNPLRSRKCEN